MSICKYCIVMLLAVAGAVSALDENEQLERDEIIQAVNSGQSTWEAGRNFHPSFKKGYVKHLLGLKKQPGGHRLPALALKDDDGVEIPKTFDARKKWGNCIALQQVKDQGPCGACWAVAAAATFTDRLCVASKMRINTNLAAGEVLSCCDECGDGCDGGDDDEAWKFFSINGICTGGDYRSHEGCQPYALPTCEHHTPGRRKNCNAYGDFPTPRCKKSCYNKNYSEHSFPADHHKVKTPFTLSNNIKQMQSEIFKHGPLQASFDVYEDFLSYKRGVYHHTSGDLIGGHAVKVIGWGVENDTPYWLVANSWNSDWGDNGFFKIQRGDNECNFESDMSGAFPIV